jgi:hypothetical protein
MRWVALWLSIASMAAGCGGDDTAAPAVPLAPVAPFEPEIGRRYDLDYRGSLRLDPESPDGVTLETTATVAVTPRGEPLAALSFYPGLYDAAVRPEYSYFDWAWPLQALSSDRPVRVEVDDWRLTVVPETPVPPGQVWTLGFEYVTSVMVLEPVDLGDMFDEQARWSRMTGGAELLELVNEAIQRFGQTALTTSFAQDQFYVLMPPWPLPFDCGGAEIDAAFAPTECVARVRLPARIEVRMPDGWDTVLPTVPAPGDGAAVLSAIPSLVVTSPAMARSTTSVGDRTVALCGPRGRGAALDDLAARVRADLPALEALLGPYPFEQLTVCLSPMPLTHSGLAHGRLALVADAMFGSVLPDDGAAPREALRRLDDWIRTSPMFRAFREELVVHELAHHWWRTELPTRWEILLNEGAASYIANTVLRERHAGTELAYFADANVWVDAARAEALGGAVPRLSEYLHHRGAAWSVTEDLLPYVHGFRLFEQVVPPDELGRVVRDRPAAHTDPEAVLVGLPGARRALRRVIERDEPLVASERVNLATYSYREAIARLEPELERAGMSPLVVLAMLHRPGAQQQTMHMYARLLGADGADWYTTGAVMALAEIDECIELPDDVDAVRRCEDRLHQDGRLVLGAVMELAETDQWIAVERDPNVWLAMPARTDEAWLSAAARRVAAAPVRVTADEARRADDVLSAGRGRAGLLFARIHARWAARAYLDLF